MQKQGRLGKKSLWLGALVVAQLAGCENPTLQGFEGLEAPYIRARDQEQCDLDPKCSGVSDDDDAGETGNDGDNVALAACRQKLCDGGKEETPECGCCTDDSADGGAEICTCVLNPTDPSCAPVEDRDTIFLGCKSEDGLKTLGCRDTKTGEPRDFCSPRDEAGECECDAISPEELFRGGQYVAKASLRGTNDVVNTLLKNKPIDLNLLLTVKNTNKPVASGEAALDGVLCIDSESDRLKPGQRIDGEENGFGRQTVNPETGEFRITLSGLLVPGGFDPALPNDAYADVIMEGVIAGPECVVGWATLFLTKSPLPCPSFVELVGSFQAERVAAIEGEKEADGSPPLGYGDAEGWGIPCLREDFSLAPGCPSAKPYFEITGRDINTCPDLTGKEPACPPAE